MEQEAWRENVGIRKCCHGHFLHLYRPAVLIMMSANDELGKLGAYVLCKVCYKQCAYNFAVYFVFQCLGRRHFKMTV